MSKGACQDALELAVKWLARREYSVHELSQRLRSREFDPQTADAVVQQLLAKNLLSDRRFTEAWVRTRIARGFGPLKIEQELRLRGIGDELIMEMVDVDGTHWLQRLEEVWRKKYGTPPQDYKTWARQARGLQSKGYTVEQIRQVVPYR